MKRTRQAADPDWKQLLRLGEQLVSQTNPEAQCNLICETVSSLLNAKVRIWLSRPAYPLPGSPDLEIETLPEAQATPLAHQAFAGSKIVRQEDSDGEPSGTRSVAVPLITNENLLGVVQLDRPSGPAFSDSEIDLLEGIMIHAASAMEVTRQRALKNWHYEQLSLVRSVSAQIANLRDPNELYNHITQLIRQTFDFYYVAIFTMDERHQHLRFRASAAYMDRTALAPDFTVKLGEGIVGTVGMTGEEIVAPDVRQEARYRYVDVLPETQSEAALPLKIENRILGVLDFQSDQLNGFHESDMLVLHALADNIALALESAQLYNNLHRRAAQISSVYEVSHALASILDPNELLTEVVRLIHNRFGYPFVHVYTVHSGMRRIIFHTGSGERSASMIKNEISYSMDAPKGILPWVARNKRTFLSNDVTQEPLYVPSDLPPHNTRAELTMPLMIGQELLGILDIQSTEPDAFDENDQSLFEALAVPIATAMKNANLYRTEQWRRMVAESFRDVAYLITTDQPLNQLLDIILEKLENNLPCDASAIWLLDEDQGWQSDETPHMHLAATNRIAPEKIIQAQQTYPEVQEMLQRALEAETPLIRTPEDPYGPLGRSLDLAPDYSSIAAPMRIGDRPMGVLILVHSQNGRYGSEAQAITATFANYAAVAIRNGQLYRESQEQALVSTMLLQVAEASQSTMTVEDLLSTMVRLTRLLVGVKKCAFLLWEDSVQSFELKAWYGFDKAGMNEARSAGEGESHLFFSPHLPAFRELSKTRSTLTIQNPADEIGLPEISPDGDRGMVVMLPLLARGEIIGAFLVAFQISSRWHSEQGFDPKAHGILQGIAHQTAMSVDNLKLLEARQEEAYVTAALLQVAQAVVSSNDLHDTLDTIVHLLPILVGIDACIIYLWDPTSQVFRPIQAQADSPREEEAILSRTYAAGEYPLLDTVWKTGEVYLCQVNNPQLPAADWTTLPCQPYVELIQDSVPPSGDWLLAYPLSLQGMVMGVMIVRENHTSPAFWERRMEIINGIAQQVSIAIQNDLFKQELVENERMEREVQLARQIQETFLPASLPHMEGWELDLRWETAREVGGDFYDIFWLDGNRLGLVVADVSDKGLPAALYMTVTRTLIHAYAMDNLSPAKVLEAVNELLINESADAMFVTTAYAIISLDTGELTYANAGHNRPLLYRAETEKVEQLPKGGTALGIINNLQLENHSLVVQPGDSLVLFTDGVVDVISPDGEFYGEERLRRIIALNGEETVESMLESLDDSLMDFRKGAGLFDDITLVAIRRCPKENESDDDDNDDE